MNEIASRKILVEHFGGPDVLRTVRATLPAPAPGYARVKVLAAGVGLTDAMARSGDYLLQRRTPFTPGYELAGEVVDFTTADTPAPSWLRPGARVAAALTRMGGYAEYVTLPLRQLVPLPDGLDPHIAAAVPLDQNDREPGGVQAVFDHIGGPALRKGYRVLAPGGVLVSYAASGRPGRIVGDTLRAAARVTLLNLRPGRRTALAMVREIRADHARYRAALTELLALAHAGTTAPQITTAPLTEAAAVHTDPERRALTGKTVLTTDC
ncbi:zinc-binding dehydrogenase [Streptomyces noursei]|uniref:zinc-binding dehydrogenase n=1 Tax=Streptomyces noursei TaxID=1971 RepID=UPI0037F669F6